MRRPRRPTRSSHPRRIAARWRSLASSAAALARRSSGSGSGAGTGSIRSSATQRSVSTSRATFAAAIHSAYSPPGARWTASSSSSRGSTGKAPRNSQQRASTRSHRGFGGADDLPGERERLVDGGSLLGREGDREPVPEAGLVFRIRRWRTVIRRRPRRLHRLGERADGLRARPLDPARLVLALRHREDGLRLPRRELSRADRGGEDGAGPELPRQPGHLPGGARGDPERLAGVVVDAGWPERHDEIPHGERIERLADGDVERAAPARHPGEEPVHEHGRLVSEEIAPLVRHRRLERVRRLRGRVERGRARPGRHREIAGTSGFH
jgi:hypothetical protein